MEILIVDDDPDIKDLLTALLESEGFQTRSASNGLEALEAIRSHAPDMILLDLMMPVMDGWQFRAEQKRESAISEIPVVVLSAAGNVEKNASVLGAEAWAEKPVDFDGLLHAIKVAERRASQRRATRKRAS
jgi:DNA-binding response OmpR family regulator